MLTLDNLSIGYRQKNVLKEVQSDLNATIHSGELTCLIGPNGAGKSTLLRTLAAFQPPLKGNVAVDGKDLSGLTPHQRSLLISIVLTTRPDVQNMSVRELVSLGRSPYTGFWGRLNAEDRNIVDESIRLAGLEALQERLVQTLSDGERQKMMVAKALAQQTPVILLDEPTAFLDYPAKVELLQLLRQLAHSEGKAIFLSTHDIELALQTADSLWLLQPQQPLAVGTPDELAKNGSLSRFLNRPGLHFNPQTLTVSIKT